MKAIAYRFISWIRRTLWAFIVAYMLGMHNFYKGEDKTIDDIGITTEVGDIQSDGMPKD